MTKTQLTHTAKKVALFLLCHIVFGLSFSAQAAQVALQWDASDPTPDEYRLYQRQAGQQNFEVIWSGTDTFFTVSDLLEGITYYFVVRASAGSVESDNSNVLQYTPSLSDTTSDSNDNIISSIGNDSQKTIAPSSLQPANGSTRVGLTPTLILANPFNNNPLSHAFTCYQISLNSDFSALVFQKTSSRHLTALDIPHLILEPDTTYYWRAKFVDQNGIESQWSDMSEFTTIDYTEAGDANGNGILDSQEIDHFMDLDKNGIDDGLQSNFQGVQTTDSFVAVKRVNENVQLGSIVSIDAAQLPISANKPDELSSIISFKLYLLNDSTTATVTIFFSEPAPSNALWYKYDPDGGWEAYGQAVFSADRKSVTLTLEDGGMGDLDGVENGIIVDPAGLGYFSQTADATISSLPEESSGGGGSGCFIATQKTALNGNGILAAIFLTLMLLGLSLIPKKKYAA